MSGRVHRRQQNRWADQDAEAYQDQPVQQVPVPAPVASGEDDVIAQIERLGGLHEKGMLTDEEFAAEKAKILG